MTEIFLQAVNLSISAGWLVLAVLLLRLALKKAPRWTALLLWGIVGLRLLIPLSIESAVSLLPSAETISPEIVYAREPTIHIGVAALNSVVNPMITASFAPDPAASANPLQIWIPAASVIWLLGAGVMLVCGLISYLRLRSRIRTAVLLQDNIYRSECTGTGAA